VDFPAAVRAASGPWQQQKEETMKATTSPIYRWHVGAVEITRVLEFEAALFEPAAIHPEASPEIIERHLTWLTPTLTDPTSGLMIFAFHSTVIKTPHATILIDTCSGNDKERPHKLRYHRKNWPYLANLAAAGFAPEDLDYVLCTHLHADHVGWNTRLLNGRWVPTFPNARYLFAREEWEHWRAAELRARYTTDPYYEDSLLPVIESGHAEFIATDYAFDDSVWIEPWPGHTPGHVCVVVRSQRASVVLSGDIMHTALQCAETRLNSCFCVDEETARATRRRFLETFADSPVMIIPAHFPTPTAGWIRSHNGSFRFQFDRLR
jgi:glyoxylase-like metal-dependent hydrolase (beta-lactamase superfamily II)